MLLSTLSSNNMCVCVCGRDILMLDQLSA
jgi:hypothetical protein